MRLLMIDREKIKMEGYRLRFKSGRMDIEDLVQSIRIHGLLCPLVAAKRGNHYRLAAGQRRLHALDRLGWKKIPVIEKEGGDKGDILVTGLVENIIRLNLSPLEKAMGMKELVETHGYSREKLADRLGIDRTTASHYLRMLDILHPGVLEYVHKSRITFGHAKVLMRLKDQNVQLEIADRVIAEDLTISQTALIVDQARPPEELNPREKILNRMEMDIRKAVGNEWWDGISIRQGRKKEQIVVDFSERAELKGVLLKIAAAL